MKDGVTIVVECKATKSPIDDNFILKWLNENIPFTRKWLLENEKSAKIEFQIWSVGGFTESALQLLQKAEQNQKFSVKYYDRQQMINVAQGKSDTHFIEIMKSHFAKPIG